MWKICNLDKNPLPKIGKHFYRLIFLCDKKIAFPE